MGEGKRYRQLGLAVILITCGYFGLPKFLARAQNNLAMFEKLKSLFVIEEEETPKPQAGSSSPSGKQEIVEAKEKSRPLQITAEGGKVRNTFMEVLFGALEKANQEGFDYLEFKQSLQSLEKMSMDEATRFQSAMAMAEAMGAKKEMLLQSAAHYLRVLQQEERKFKQTLQKQQDQKVLRKQKELEKLNQSILGKEEQIRKLRREIEQERKTAQEIQQAVASEKQKIEATARDFMASLQALSGKIKADVEKMKQYLK